MENFLDLPFEEFVGFTWFIVKVLLSLVFWIIPLCLFLALIGVIFGKILCMKYRYEATKATEEHASNNIHCKDDATKEK